MRLVPDQNQRLRRRDRDNNLLPDAKQGVSIVE